MHELKACGVLIVECEPANSQRIRRFLLMRHPTRWDLPKGHVDPGETDEFDTALRELSEETGIPADAVELDPDFRFEHHYRVRSQRTGGEEWPKTLVIFLGRLLRPVEIQLTEHTGYQWFTWRPPHQIQPQTIDPLLDAVERFVASSTTG